MSLSFNELFDNVWSILMVILFFGGSIFVHELGHFLAAKWRGLHIERFSIGFGPRLFGWKRNGVDYRVSLLPLGGYVALPQLADMRGIEGDSSVELEKMPPISYSSKVIVAVAGAVFNVLFALALGCILWKTGVERENATTIGSISETIEISEGQFVPNPATQAGLRIGDQILSIDGEPVNSFEDIFFNVILGTGMTEDGRRKTDVEFLRKGQRQVVSVEPILHPTNEMRMIGISPNMDTYITATTSGFPAEESGLRKNDIIRKVDNVTIFSAQHLTQIIRQAGNKDMVFEIERISPDGSKEQQSLRISPVLSKFNISDEQFYAIGAGLESQLPTTIVHIDPLSLSLDVINKSYKTLKSVFHRHSDAKFKDMSGPVGIATVIAKSSKYGILRVIEIALFINISLAVFNLLPIPVLDGGHIMFATIAKLTGKPIPPSFAASLQGAFMLLLFSFMLYVTYYDIGRLIPNDKAIEREPVKLIRVENPPS